MEEVNTEADSHQPPCELVEHRAAVWQQRSWGSKPAAEDAIHDAKCLKYQPRKTSRGANGFVFLSICFAVFEGGAAQQPRATVKY